MGSGLIGVTCVRDDSKLLKEESRKLGLSIYSSVVKGLPSMHEAIHSISVPERETKAETERDRKK